MRIRLTEGELVEIIKKTVEIISEKRYDLRGELICRLPYFVTIVFTDHCIEREYERSITEQDIISDAETAIKTIISDFERGKIKKNDYFKIVNRETCVVTVFSMTVGRMKDNPGQLKINQLVAVTSYIWDGRMNIDNGQVYYIGDESRAYAEAKEWNAERQDLVKAYTEWKRNTLIAKQRRKAEHEYDYRTNTDIPDNIKMGLVLKTYKTRDKMNKQAIHDAMDQEDFKEIQKYYNDINKKPLSSKGSANRDLRAMDLWKRRKESQD